MFLLPMLMADWLSTDLAVRRQADYARTHYHAALALSTF